MHLQQSESYTDSKVIHYLKYLHICFNMPMHLYVIQLHKCHCTLSCTFFLKFIMGILIVVTENYSVVFDVHGTVHHECILLSITNKMQRHTIFFIIVNGLHVSGGFSAHHQELENCTQHRVYAKLACCYH